MKEEKKNISFSLILHYFYIVVGVILLFHWDDTDGLPDRDPYTTIIGTTDGTCWYFVVVVLNH